jgi:lipoate-protein ligase A
MNLHLLPTRTGGAAENMALDFLLLQRYPDEAAIRFRHYEWRRPACTFGFGQKIEFVRANLPSNEPLDLCRRPTGGGIVDHRSDWTYSLVIPRGHGLFDERAAQSYHLVHACLAEALIASGQPAELKAVAVPADGDAPDAAPGISGSDPTVSSPGICFQRAEVHDVIDPRTGAKIAGAAQKRNKHGLLLQGSVEKSSVGPVDWDGFAELFTATLGQTLGTPALETPWPDLDEDEVAGLIELYSTAEWNDRR